MDAPHTPGTADNLKHYTCVLLSAGSVYVRQVVIDRCPSHSPPELQSLCDIGEAGTWSPGGWLVSDTSTNLT